MNISVGSLFLVQVKIVCLVWLYRILTGVHICSCGSPNLPPAPDTQETCSTHTKLKNFSKLNSNCQLKPFEINLISSKTRDFLPFQTKPWVLDIVYFKNNKENIVNFKALVERARFIMNMNIAASFFIHDFSMWVDCCDSFFSPASMPSVPVKGNVLIQ